MGSPYQQVATSAGERCVTLGIAWESGKGIKLCVVVEAEAHVCTLHRLSLGIGYVGYQRRHLGIVGCHVDFGVAGRLAQHLLRAFVATENTSVHEHPTGSRCIEPPKVEHRLRFAGSQEMPLAIHPGFHPGMIVIGVAPSGGIDLACGNAYRTESCHAERALLAAASYS